MKTLTALEVKKMKERNELIASRVKLDESSPYATTYIFTDSDGSTSSVVQMADGYFCYENCFEMLLGSTRAFDVIIRKFGISGKCRTLEAFNAIEKDGMSPSAFIRSNFKRFNDSEFKLPEVRVKTKNGVTTFFDNNGHYRRFDSSKVQRGSGKNSQTVIAEKLAREWA